MQTMRIGQHDFFEAFVIHGSAICFRSSDCDSSLLCSVPSYMPSFGEKDKSKQKYEWGALSDVPLPPGVDSEQN